MITHLFSDVRYKSVKADSRARKETKDCSVISMAIVLGIPYAKSHEAFAKCGRLYRAGTSAIRVNGVLYHFGVKYRRYNKFEVQEMSNSLLTFKTIPVILKPKGKYLLISKKHSAAVIDRKVVDWSAGSDREVVSLVEILL